MKLFTQPCLIKKNTAKLRKQLEDLGYTRTKLLSIESEYDNDKEPWIFAAYDMYVCLDEHYYNTMLDSIDNNEMFQSIEEISKDVLDCKKNENMFMENVKKSIEFDFTINE